MSPGVHRSDPTEPWNRTSISGLRALDKPQGHSHVISLVDPGWRIDPVLFEAWPPSRHLVLGFHDEIEAQPGRILPSGGDVSAILDFARQAEDAAEGPPRFFIHCMSGVSRSTAAALMVWAQAAPKETETRLVERLAALKPACWPNSLMTALADKALGRDGRLIAALKFHFRRQVAGDPAIEERMRRLRRDRDLEP